MSSLKAGSIFALVMLILIGACGFMWTIDISTGVVAYKGLAVTFILIIMLASIVLINDVD